MYYEDPLDSFEITDIFTPPPPTPNVSEELRSKLTFFSPLGMNGMKGIYPLSYRGP